MATHDDHAHGPDAGYGPTPAGAGHEHTDINPKVGYQFAVWLTVAMLISAGIVYGTMRLIGSQVNSARDAEAQYPLASKDTPEPPAPRLQTQPFKDVYLLKQAERERLSSYGWVEKAQGTVHIPIEEAMRLTIERGLPVRPGGNADGLNLVVQDSSSGRTSAPRY